MRTNGLAPGIPWRPGGTLAGTLATLRDMNVAAAYEAGIPMVAGAVDGPLPGIVGPPVHSRQPFDGDRGHRRIDLGYQSPFYRRTRQPPP